jgi:hypothetical protein
MQQQRAYIRQKLRKRGIESSKYSSGIENKFERNEKDSAALLFYNTEHIKNNNHSIFFAKLFIIFIKRFMFFIKAPMFFIKRIANNVGVLVENVGIFTNFSQLTT